MEQIVDVIINLFNIAYMSAVVFSTWFILKHLIKKTTSNQKTLVSLITGITFGLLWVVYFKEPLDIMISSFFASVVLYQWVIKNIMKKLNISYDDNKTII